MFPARRAGLALSSTPPRTRPGGPVTARFETKRLPAQRDAVAPDGSDVRILLRLEGGSLAHFELAPGQTSVAAAHRTIEEIWYFISGRGELWRRLGGDAGAGIVVDVGPGVCITIPTDTRFQFRAHGNEPLAAVAVTMPPWPGPGEAYAVPGHWPATVDPGPP